MNEVTQIHLGRQAFTIAANAHTTLRTYLNAIEKAVGDKDVVEEVEIRMAELLAEHGVTGEKVILPEDVEYLKAQLGDPKDFSTDDDTEASGESKESGSRRFFRDSDNAILGGVAAGLANYLNIDVAIVRVALIVLAFLSGGSVIPIYIILWWVVPPATTASEKLQMRGLPVTLEALKESVSNADLAGKAKSINSAASSAINRIFRAVLKLIGVGFIAGGLLLILLMVTVKTYMMAHNGQLFQENLFPIGFHEQLAVVFAMALLVIVAMFLILAGITTFKRKWPINSWVTVVLLGLFLVGSAATTALAADAVPRVRNRYEAIEHVSAIKGITPFDNVVSTGSVDFEQIQSASYAVNVSYVENPDLSKLKIYVKDNTLHVDSSQLDGIKHCNMLCLFPGYNMRVQVFAPNIKGFDTPPHTDIFYPNVPALPDSADN